jgi:hypothetical protein
MIYLILWQESSNIISQSLSVARHKPRSHFQAAALKDIHDQQTDEYA